MQGHSTAACRRPSRGKAPDSAVRTLAAGSPAGALCRQRAQDDLAALQANLGHQLALAGPADGAYVYDLTAKQALFSERATAMRPPASVEKLYTATTALELMGADDAPRHDRARRRPPGARRRLGRQPVPARRRRPDVRLAPRSSTATTAASARASPRSSPSSCAADGIHHITGSIEGDESYFDSLRGEPSSDYAPDPFLEGTLSALAFNRGETGSRTRRPRPRRATPRASCGRRCKTDGVSVAGASGAATHARRARSSSRRRSRRRSRSCSALMLPPSDNFFAETLVKDLGARFGGAGTTAAGAAVVRTDDRGAARHPPARRRRLGPLAKRTRPPPTRSPTCSSSSRRRRSARCCANSLAVAGRTRHARTAHAPHRAPPAAARARPARSRASRTSSATARPPTGTRSRSRSSPTASRSKPRTPSRTTSRSPSPTTDRFGAAHVRPRDGRMRPSTAGACAGRTTRAARAAPLRRAPRPPAARPSRASSPGSRRRRRSRSSSTPSP